MKLGKHINGTFTLVECEDGKEVGGQRTEEELYADGYKKVCLTEGEGESVWREHPACFVQEFVPAETDPSFGER